MSSNLQPSIALDSGWEFTQVPSANIPVEKEAWIPCSAFPTSVQSELIKAGKIPHPFKELNEWDIQWIAEANWRFRARFTLSLSQLSEISSGEQFADLLLEGLDTYCDVTLNGRHVIYTDNMFLHHRVPVKHLLKEGVNTLLLDFKAPLLEARKEQATNGGPRTLWNGESSRLYSRKAQYGWGLGWDWGPIIMTIGPWRTIKLETYTTRFDDIRIDSSLSPDLKTAYLKLALDIVSESDGTRHSSGVKAVLRKMGSSEVIQEQILEEGKRQLDWTFENSKIEAWWPVGYGTQPLYELELQLLDENGNEVATSTSRVAFRNARVVQEPLENEVGTSFLFEVNGTRIFCGGSNWIPGDSFLTDITPERYRKWIELLVGGNQNMLRVWGGGIYEDEALYDACDELGVLVWQDFMFGCGLYPSYEKINQSIKLEAEQTVRRLRNHPSVVIFAGNNEDYQVAEAEGVIDYNDESGDYLHSKFPGRHIYEIILPEVVGRLSTVHYHRSSPYGGKDTRDRTVGDIHQWNVWHGTQEPWRNWDKLAGRFVSEFGMQGYPDGRTVKEWSDDETQLFPQSRVSVQHNKADGFERRLELYLMENFRHSFDMPGYIYYTQIMQAECLSAAYRLWRRKWKGKGREYTAGALVWQLNDCWPCVSWSICDYYLRPKPAYFAIKRELKPYTVGIIRKEVRKYQNDNTAALLEIHEELELWGCNSTLQPKKVRTDLTSFDLDRGEVDHRQFDTTLAPNSSSEIWKGMLPGQPTRTSDAQTPRSIVVHARMVDEKDKVIARYSSWPEPYKFIVFPDPNLEVEVINGDRVRLSCVKPVKGIVLDVEGENEGEEEECQWSDQAIDLFPGDEQIVRVTGLGKRKVKVRYLGDGSA